MYRSVNIHHAMDFIRYLFSLDCGELDTLYAIHHIEPVQSNRFIILQFFINHFSHNSQLLLCWSKQLCICVTVIYNVRYDDNLGFPDWCSFTIVVTRSVWNLNNLPHVVMVSNLEQLEFFNFDIWFRDFQSLRSLYIIPQPWNWDANPQNLHWQMTWSPTILKTVHYWR